MSALLRGLLIYRYSINVRCYYRILVVKLTSERERLVISVEVGLETTPLGRRFVYSVSWPRVGRSGLPSSRPRVLPLVPTRYHSILQTWEWLE